MGCWYFADNQCEKPADPENVNTVFCASFTDEDSRDYKQCSVVCNTNYTTVVPAPRVHTCGPAGSWDPPNRYLPYTLSPCGGETQFACLLSVYFLLLFCKQDLIFVTVPVLPFFFFCHFLCTIYKLFTEGLHVANIIGITLVEMLCMWFTQPPQHPVLSKMGN